ncbi:ATP-binding protein [Marixanthomonas spongiae]|uniref:AAA family ATPase n=1 Tax=Marixanthomonas spongiae TaxID=2174845 RepID=A0A2U0I282_9FLAO|nr:AAA family ATPase [Marixanthomonas spongiae]PVW15217.1 AAA family ATPase [Marixanthomonas spongiae]
MDELLEIHESLIHALKNDKRRYLLEKIDWSNRLIAIKGARGSGKTTLLLQRIKYCLPEDNTALYTSLDNLYFLENNVVSLAKEFTLQGGTHLFLDEVHVYPNWSRELKLIYDQFPNLHVVFTSSSMLQIDKGAADLSRRAVRYFLKELSFREFVYLKKGFELPVLTLDELINNHTEIARNVKDRLQSPMVYFKEYLKIGAYPYFLENPNLYQQKLLTVIDLILETDLNVIENIGYTDSRKIKKLLIAISQTVPFVPNVSKLSERLGISRNFLVNSIKILNRAELLQELFSPTKGIGALTKPEKLYLNNTNLVYVLSKNQPSEGTLRETFFANQMKHLYETHLPKKGDFLIEGKYTFEVGGKGKKNDQIKGVPNAFVVSDNMEIGSLNVIPLHLFGLLY